MFSKMSLPHSIISQFFMLMLLLIIIYMTKMWGLSKVAILWWLCFDPLCSNK
jgi:asparagine N-glycosylation enzyme membrane subunit Stt3